MKAEIISVGTELLLGHTVNTNTAFLCGKLAGLGIDVYHTSVVGDNPGRLVEAVNQAAHRSDIVIATGGLGPTVDDITAATVSRIAHGKIKRIANKVGTAPGIIAQYMGKLIVCLPGPPRELEPMFEYGVAPLISSAPLRVRYNVDKSPFIIKSRTIKIVGLPESVVNNKVRGLLALKPPTTVGIYAKLGQVELKIMAKARNERTAASAIANIEKRIRRKLGGYIFGCDDDTLEGGVVCLLVRKNMTLAIAESCTGGLLSNRITNVSGCSKSFIMGLVAYSNSIKIDILGVPEETVKRHGAVSRQVAIQMAARIRSLANSDIGVSITGIAGPTGGTRSKPVGLVYIAFSSKRGQSHFAKEFRFRGSREEIKFQASQAALDMIRGIF